MQLTQRIPFRSGRSARDRLRRRSSRAPAMAEPASPARSEADQGPPQDRATHTCACGYGFDADVTTTIRCPHCSAELAW